MLVQLPPKENLWLLAEQGADIVLFSGGKEIGGPQTTGLIIGRCVTILATYHSDMSGCCCFPSSALNGGVGNTLM